MFLDNTSFKVFLLLVIISALICIMAFAGLTIKQYNNMNKNDREPDDNTRYAFAIISLIAGIILLFIFTILLFSYLTPLRKWRKDQTLRVLENILNGYNNTDLESIKKTIGDIILNRQAVSA